MALRKTDQRHIRIVKRKARVFRPCPDGFYATHDAYHPILVMFAGQARMLLVCVRSRAVPVVLAYRT